MNRNKIIGKRKENRMTQAEIAKVLGISEASYREKEKGNRQFTESEIEKMSILLKVSIDYFFTK